VINLPSELRLMDDEITNCFKMILSSSMVGTLFNIILNPGNSERDARLKQIAFLIIA
jgi:hypothetical protein